MQRALKLSLSSPIWMRETNLSLTHFIARSEKKDRGYEAAIHMKIICSDEGVSIERLGAGERDGYTEDERKRIERGESIEQKDDETFVIPDGPYIFEQIPFLPEERELIRVLLPYLSKTETEVYVRIYKENMLETVMQLLFPIG